MNSRPACDKRDAQGKKLTLTPRSGLSDSAYLSVVRDPSVGQEAWNNYGWLRCAGQVQPLIDPFSWVQGIRDFSYSFTAKKKNAAGFGHGIRECLGDVGTHVSEMPSAISRTMKMLWSLCPVCRHSSQVTKSTVRLDRWQILSTASLFWNLNKNIPRVRVDGSKSWRWR